MASVHQLGVIKKIMLTSSTLSLVGGLALIAAYLLEPRCRKPINRLAYYSAFGNVIVLIATFGSIEGYRLGITNGYCQLQALLIQSMLMADVIWIFIMAFTVALIMSRRWSTEDLQDCETKLIAVAYGVPTILALILLGVQTSAGVHVYGNATLYCWIGSTWQELRLYAFYLPIWILIFITMLLFISVGLRIREVKMENRNFRSHNSGQPKTDRSDSKPSKAVSDLAISHQLDSPRDATRGSSNQLANYSRPPASNPNALATVEEAQKQYVTIAFMYFIGLMLVWIPASANRVWSLIYPGEFNYGLQCVAAFVLPIQGLVNFIIFVYVTRNELQVLARRLSVMIRGKSSTNRHMLPVDLPSALCVDHTREQGLNPKSPSGSTSLKVKATASLSKLATAPLKALGLQAST